MRIAFVSRARVSCLARHHRRFCFYSLSLSFSLPVRASACECACKCVFKCVSVSGVVVLFAPARFLMKRIGTRRSFPRKKFKKLCARRYIYIYIHTRTHARAHVRKGTGFVLHFFVFLFWALARGREREREREREAHLGDFSYSSVIRIKHK